MHHGQVPPSSFRYTERSYSAEYVPTVFDNKTHNIQLEGNQVSLSLWYLLAYAGTLPDNRPTVGFDQSRILIPISS